MVEALGYVLPSSVCFERVDDLSHVLVDKSRVAVLQAAVKAGCIVKGGVDELGLRLSDKSVILPAGSATAEAAAGAMREMGIPMRTVATADDLGIEAAAGRRRAVASTNVRIRRGAKRARRVHGLTKVFKEAAKLAPTGVAPMQSYGHVAQGASCSQVEAMRRNMKLCTHLGRLRGCMTTTLKWVFGSGCDPAVSIRVEQLGEWCDIWADATSGKRQRIHKQWMRLMPSLVNNSGRWSVSGGPMAATICTLVEIGWKPISPSAWLVEEGLVAYVSGTAYAKAHILARAAQDLEKILCKAAEAHAHGNGLGGHLNLQAARKAKAHLVKQGRYTEAAAVDYIVTGVYADPPAREEGTPRPAEEFCHRCGGTVLDTRWHALYGCPGNESIDDPIMERTKHLITRASEGWDHNACLWARGIIPGAWLPQREEVQFTTARVWETPGFGALLAETRKGYSDGAGGRKSVPPCIRKVACGAAVFKGCGPGGCMPGGGGEERAATRVEGICAELPGKQTVPRAEVWGSALMAARGPAEGPLDIGVDASYVINGIARRGVSMKGPNGDVWSVLFRILDQRKGPTRFFKIKSHLVEKRARGDCRVRHPSHGFDR